MKCTVNIMSYRYGHLAAHAIESVVNQTTPFAVIRLYDDGVGDCEKLAEIYPEIEVIQRPHNLGIIENFNQALKDTTTERVLFLGADNWLSPYFNEYVLSKEEDIVWTYGRKIYSQEEMWAVEQPHGSSVYNTRLAQDCGGYEASGHEHTEEDSMLFGKMRAAGASTAVIRRPLFYYRWRHRGNFNK